MPDVFQLVIKGSWRHLCIYVDLSIPAIGRAAVAICHDWSKGLSSIATPAPGQDQGIGNIWTVKLHCLGHAPGLLQLSLLDHAKRSGVLFRTTNDADGKAQLMRIGKLRQTLVDFLVLQNCCLPRGVALDTLAQDRTKSS